MARAPAHSIRLAETQHHGVDQTLVLQVLHILTYRVQHQGHDSSLNVVFSAQYVCWAELLYIQLLTPRASFLGHLGGILAGACDAPCPD